MKNKDEILWVQPQPTPESVTMEGAKRAMDIWAKQLSILFSEWCSDNKIKYRRVYKRWEMIVEEADGKIYKLFPTEEIYDLFYQSLTHKQ